MSAPVWGPLSPGDDTAPRRAGRCWIWLRSAEDEWEVSWSYADEPPAEPPADTAWTRYVSTEDDTLELAPALPNRPVVVRPDSPIVILPGRWGRFYIGVPLWIQFVSHPHGRRTVMEEIPSRKLAATWFGDPAGGEQCYAIESPLLRGLAGMAPDQTVAVCEVVVRNQSRERLQFERICVHVEYMRLFRTHDRFWTNEVRVTFKGVEQTSQLTFAAGPPSHVADPQPICEPRQPPESGLLKRSFNLIREIAGI